MTTDKSGGAAFPFAQIIVLPPKLATPRLRKQIKDAGLILIEAEDPDQVRLIQPSLHLGGNELAVAAIKAVVKAGQFGDVPKAFMSNLLDALTARQGETK